MACLVLGLASPALAQSAVADSGITVLAAMEQATIAAIESSEKSVVAISRVRRDRVPNAQVDQLRFDELRLGSPFPSDTPDSPDFVPTFFGSGIVISEDGFIVTCGHVLGDPRENDYYVWLDKQGYSARVIGLPAKVQASDPFSDLAVIKVDASNLKPATFSSTELRKGQFVIALGNPQAIARDGRASASWGIVSNLNRFAPSDKLDGDGNKETVHHYGTLIQTDAKLNLGMSGGGLINLKGEFIGITTALAASAGYEQSAGFAIATDATFLRVVETLKAGKLPEFGFLGIQPEDLRRADRARGLRGARVSVVIPGLPGDLAGLRADDVIFKVDEQSIVNRNDLFRELSQAAAGREVQLHIQRFRPGRNAPDVLQLPAMLSKKPTSTQRPAYAVNASVKWRGLLVDYATAIQTELTRGGLGGGRSVHKLAIQSVDPDTPTWRAGLRPGYGILSINNSAVETPEDFYRIAEESPDEVSIKIVRGDQRPETIRILSATY